jgi:F0F1-type ATP synthase membrane subunit b/b'
MNEASLPLLELEVEAARAKLAGDLATLRSPATYQEFTEGLKQEAFEAKDAMIEKAKSSAVSKMEEFVEDIKARAAANPAAALAIGAGIAWRLLRRPPIATALVGAGLVSLLRTTPRRTAAHVPRDYMAEAKMRLKEQASELAETVKGEAGRLTGVVKEQAAEIAEQAKRQAVEFAGEAKEQAARLGDTARQQAAELAGTARSQVQQAREQARHMAGDAQARVNNTIGDARRQTSSFMERTADAARERSGTVADTMSSVYRNVTSDRDTRDKILLGAAGVAVVAALTIAAERRLSETSGAD